MNENLFKRATVIRQFEEKVLSLFSEGRISGTVHTCIGQELCALAVMDHLQEGDWIFSNHRCHGHYLAYTQDVRGLLAEIMGKANGICSGHGGSQHIFNGQFFSNGVQGGAMPIAAGCALAMKVRRGTPVIAVAFIGDGTLGEGVVYETLNLAAKLQVPLLVVLEHNGYAQSTRTAMTLSGSIRGRFEAFGWRYWGGSIWDEEELFAQAAGAIDFVRHNREPAVLCIDCYRLKAHSKGDDNRDAAEINAYLDRDPVQVFALKNPAIAKRVHGECSVLLDEALARMNDRTTTPLDGLQKTSSVQRSSWIEVKACGDPQRVVDRLRAGLRELMAKDERVFLLGEDIVDPYGGAFKVTKGLSGEFPTRVLNMPISEAAIVGLGNGLAVAGLRPIVEIMFGDFITLAADQIINQASKFSYMYNQRVNVPVLIRTPMGGKRGYGPTHSQCLEKHFLGTPGLSMVAVNSIFDPALLIQRIHAHLAGPCLLIENKLLYTMPLHQTAADERQWYENGQPFPTLRLPAAGSADLTIVVYGGMVEDVEAAVKSAFIEDEILVEVVVPTMVYPLDPAPIVESVARTGRLLVVEEGQGFAGFGAEVIAACAEKLPGQLLATGRVCAAPHPIPCSRELEKEALPDAMAVSKGIRDLLKR